MTRPPKTKPHGGNREASANTMAWTSDSGAEHSAESADALIRLGLTLALSGCDALALAIHTPARGMVEACDCITAAGQYLALSAEFSDTEKGLREGDA